jgi:transposase-like protein
MTKRKSYSKEFKRDTVSLVLEQNYSRAAALNLDVGVNALIYQNPQHDYTKKLLDLIPLSDPEKERQRILKG